ncbi:MAG: ATP-binding protein [Betaproteobacteria bacterium]
MRLQQSQAAMAQEGAARALSLAKALDAARAAAGDLNKKLQEEHRRKDEFLAMLAHELRNPLAPLVNSVAILRRTGQAGPSGLPRILDIMERQISQLSRLVDDLLDVSRVSRGAITLQRETLALADVMQAAIETVTPMVETKRHRLTTHGLQHQTHLVGDRTRLIQVFSNLLQNAAKYTPAGGAMDIELVRDADRVSVKIKDNGVGIPAEMQAPVFELFTQAHAAIDRAEGGLGIGLTLARTLVNLHGGELSVYSAGLGSGSVFTVHLPLADAAMSDAAPQSEPRSISQGPPARVVRVLIVEDNPDVSATIAELLQHMQAQVRVAHDGEQALTTAKEFDPELVLLDIGLPGMSGYEVASRLRSAIGGHLRLVALTGYGSPADRERARRAGFDDHLVKPASPETLQRILRQISDHA